jgi:hypothetical protein
MAVILLVVVFGRLSAPSTTRSNTQGGTADDSELEQARQELVTNTSLVNCRDALQHINMHLSQAGIPRAPANIDALRQRTDLGLDSTDFDEIQGANYTLLDGHHLQFCLLLRDAARVFDVGALGRDKRVDPLLAATAAFDWVVRQVRLSARPAVPAPPDWVLRRGRGTELDRAFIYLSLLRQLSGPDGRPGHYVGSLIFCPGADQNLRLWACGVAVPGKSGLYLFDPRLGIAIPGPGGKGVATLAQARQGDVLRQLDDPGGARYDVTAEQAQAPQIYLFYPLSALAPRQQELQDQLLPPAVEVQLAADIAGDLRRLRQEAGVGADKTPPIAILEKAAKMWRNFLMSEEGGAARSMRLRLSQIPGFADPGNNMEVLLPPQTYFTVDLAPWYCFPQEFHRRPDLQQGNILGQRIRNLFSTPWEHGTLDPGRARDALLRGQCVSAAQQLVAERDGLQKDQDRAAAAPKDLERRLDAWIDQARAAFAQMLRAQANNPAGVQKAQEEVAKVWQDDIALPVLVLLGRAQFPTRGAEVTFQLGLSKQEQAERLQMRLDLLGSGALPEELEKLHTAWRDALGWWIRYATDYPEGIDRIPVHRLRGRAEQALGDFGSARRSWQDVGGPPKEAERIAAAYPDPLWAKTVEGYAEWEKLALLYRARQMAQPAGK